MIMKGSTNQCNGCFHISLNQSKTKKKKMKKKITLEDQLFLLVSESPLLAGAVFVFLSTYSQINSTFLFSLETLVLIFFFRKLKKALW